MKVLKHLNNPTFFSNLSQSYPVQSITSTGLYRAYNSFPPSTIICNPNQIFSNPFTQYNQIPPSIHYSHLPITNAIPANYYSCQSLPINYSVPSLSYPGRYNTLSSFSYSSLPTGITYSSATYQSLNPPIPPNFYAPQSSNLPHNIVSSNLSIFNVSSYRSNQVALDSNPPIEFADNFSMRIKKADDSYDKLDLKQIAHLVPIGFTGGILEPEINSRNNKLKICNSVSLSEVQSKIWIRNGDNLVELPNHLLEKNSWIYNQNSNFSSTISQHDISTQTNFIHDNSHTGNSKGILSIMTKLGQLTKSIERSQRITNLEREILGASFSGEDLSTSTQDDKELTSISDSTTPSSQLSLSLSPSSQLSLSLSPSSPPTTIISKLEIMTLREKMVNGDLDGYGIGSEFIIRFTEKPNLTGRAIIC